MLEKQINAFIKLCYLWQKNLTFIKNQEFHNFHNISNDLLKMKKLNLNEFLLIADQFMPELHLKEPGSTYSACGPFTNHRERIQKFIETGNWKHLHSNKLDKACFAHDAAYSDSKDLKNKNYFR